MPSLSAEDIPMRYRFIRVTPLSAMVAALAAAVILIVAISFGATLAKATFADTCKRYGAFAMDGVDYSCRALQPLPDTLP